MNNFGIRLTPMVKILAIACIAGFLLQQTADRFMGGNLLGWFALVPMDVVGRFRIWQVATYSFLHGDIGHLVLNLLMLVFIGGEIEAVWGAARFLKFYFSCVVFAGMFYLALQLFTSGGGLHSPMVGASGGIYGLLMAYGLLFGDRVLLFMMLFPMKAKHFVWVLAAVEFFSTLFSGTGGGGVASAAHLGGMVAGFAYLWFWAAWRVSKRKRGESAAQADVRARTERVKQAAHLRLVKGDTSPEGGETRDRKPGPGGGGKKGDDGPTWH